MLKGEYMAEELEKWRYPRFFSDTIDENAEVWANQVWCM